MAEYRAGTIGAIIEVRVVDDSGAVDVSGATTKQFVFLRPDDTIQTVTASFVNSGTDGLLKYTTVSGDFADDYVGDWRGEVYLEGVSGWTGAGSPFDFTVIPRLATDVGRTTSDPDGYCSPTLFLQFFDYRNVAQLVSDTGTPVTAANITADPNVITALRAASGDVESACLTGGRYTSGDLASLTGTTSMYLARIVANLAMGILISRRPMKNAMPGFYQEAKEVLAQLRLGERIFSIQDTADAGHYENISLTEQDIINQNLVTLQSRRLFGERSNLRRFYGSRSSDRSF